MFGRTTTLQTGLSQLIGVCIFFYTRYQMGSSSKDSWYHYYKNFSLNDNIPPISIFFSIVRGNKFFGGPNNDLSSRAQFFEWKTIVKSYDHGVVMLEEHRWDDHSLRPCWAKHLD